MLARFTGAISRAAGKMFRWLGPELNSGGGVAEGAPRRKRFRGPKTRSAVPGRDFSRGANSRHQNRAGGPLLRGAFKFLTWPNGAVPLIPTMQVQAQIGYQRPAGGEIVATPRII